MNCATVGDIMTSDAFDAYDKAAVKWRVGALGGFYRALWDAISQADDSNLERLELAFPVEVEGYRRWIHGDLGRRLRAAGLEI